MKRDNGPYLMIVPDVRSIAGVDCIPGFIAVCSCGWSGTFYPADDDHDTHDRAHADATTEGDEHAAGHGRRG